MAPQQLDVPHIDAYNVGVGVDLLSGTVMNQAVRPTATTVGGAAGSNQFFQVARVSSTEDRQRKLGIYEDRLAG